MLLSNLIKILKTDTALNTLLGERIYPVRLPQDVRMPAMCINRINDVEHGYTQQGPDHFVESILQIDCYGEQYVQAVLAAEYTQAAIDGYKGAWNTSPVGGVFLQDARTEYEETTNIYRVSQDYRIFYGEVTE